MTNQEIEDRIITLLRSGPMKQTEIVDAFPFDCYMVIRKVIRDMDRRGVIIRTLSRPTYIVRLP